MKNLDKKTLIVMGVALVGVILAIVGICVPFMTATAKNQATSQLVDMKLGEFADIGLKMSGFVSFLAYITLVGAIVSLVLVVIKPFVSFGLLPKITKIASIVTAIITALFVIFGIICCITNREVTYGTTVELWFAIGAWLLTIGGLASAGSAFYSVKK